MIFILIAAVVAGILAIVFRDKLFGTRAPAVTVPTGAFPLDPSLWAISGSVRLPPNPTADGSGGWYLDIPVGPDGAAAWAAASVPAVHYVISTVNADLSTKTMVSVDVELMALGSPKLQYNLQADNTGSFPASVRVLLQRTGDDMSSAGPMEFYRWWSEPIHFELKDGTATLDVPLQPDQWLSVLGKKGDASADATAGFRACLASVDNIGLTFGGGSFFGHGVNIDQGTARFSLTRFAVS